MRRLPLLILTTSLVLLATSNAHAFMTWDTWPAPGNAEHERITRLALACNSALDRPAAQGLDWNRDLCLNSAADQSYLYPFAFERSLRMVAGAASYFGGVGAPDRLAETLHSYDSAHCDNSDTWFPTSQGPFGSYPRTVGDRDRNLTNCLTLLQQYVNVAVTQAGSLVTADGRLDAPQSDLSEDCNVDYDPALAPNQKHDRGWAKCNALIAFGRALHITEDFFSHSNWIDTNPSALGLTQPQGLSEDPRVVPAALGYPRSSSDIRNFLDLTQVITGAYPKDSARVSHDDYLNKDEGNGYIRWITGQIPRGDGGHSERAAAGFDGVSDNFQRAVKGAAYAAASVWTDYRNAIISQYGGARGAQIWHALRADTPWTRCAQSGEGRRSLSPPNGVQSAHLTIRMRVVNNSSSDLPCNSVQLDDGEWSSLPADSFAPGTTSEFLVLSNQGSITGQVDLGGATFSFSNPLDPLERNSGSCQARAGYVCNMSVGRGLDATFTVTISGTGLTSRSTDTTQPADRATPGNAAGSHGSAAAIARSRDRDNRQRTQTLKALNPGISANNRRELRSELKGLRGCGGAGAALKLRVDDVACGKVLRLMISSSRDDLMRRCPVGWRVQYFPQGIGAPKGATLCHQDSDVNNSNPDHRARAFVYSLPH